MNVGAIFIGIAILIITIPFVVNPLIPDRKKLLRKPAPAKKDGRDQGKDTLAAIRDLDFDFQTGKVSREDYETLRTQLVIQAAEYLQMERQEEEKLEAMIRARLQAVKPSVKCGKCGGKIGPQDHFCPTCGVVVDNPAESNKQDANIICPGCGKSVKEGDHYCTVCGTRVNRQAAAVDTPAER